MIDKSDLKAIELCLMMQVFELKEKLTFYKSCRMYERIENCQRALKHFEAIREKVAHLAEETEQLTVTKI